MSVGERIRTLREYLGMTQEDFGKPCGCTGSYVSRLERGINEPSEEVLFSIASVTDVRMEWLRDGQGEMLYKYVPPADYSSVGERVRKVRKDNGLKQREFAKRIHSSLDMVSKTELGKIKPSSHWLQKVSKEFGVSMQYLLTGVEADGKKKKPDIAMDRIDTFMRKNEVARVAVLEAINSGNEDIWRMLEKLIRERNQS